jgi:Outer membrane protein Omp28
MKYFYFFCLGLYFICTACDKVENPYPPTIKTDLDTTIYPGMWKDYLANEWPDFSQLTSVTTRNALIEDYTGHNCSFCPAAAAVAHSLVAADPEHVFAASIHASNTTNGMSSFQALNSAQGYTIDFTNAEGLSLGAFFGNTLINSGFYGNPAGSINRTNDQGEYFMATGSWGSHVNAVKSSVLRVGLNAKLNYFETPKKGFFLHTEVAILDNSLEAENLALVAYMMEDSLVGPQNVSNTFTPNYVHRDIFRGTIDNQIWGRTLNSSYLKNGKYYLDYSAIVPNQLAPSTAGSGAFNAENMHVLVYVYDKTTLEIYQVLKLKFNP